MVALHCQLNRHDHANQIPFDSQGIDRVLASAAANCLRTSQSWQVVFLDQAAPNQIRSDAFNVHSTIDNHRCQWRDGLIRFAGKFGRHLILLLVNEDQSLRQITNLLWVSANLIRLVINYSHNREKTMKKFAIAVIVAGTLTGCATVRQSDLDAWVGMPVEALDTQSFFITLPMTKKVTASGIEVRNYANTKVLQDCDDTAYATPVKGGSVTAYGTTTCTSSKVGCNNIFYIKNGKVLEYAPTGQCMTNETVRPQKRYLDMIGK